MIRALHIIRTVLAMLAMAMLLWLLIPSSVFMRPMSMALDGDKLTFVRATPFGDASVTWISDITLLDRDGFECHGMGNAIIQKAENDLVTATIGAWSRDCISAGPPFVLRYEYQVWALGLIPLRTTGISIKVEGEE